jgi:hypothetical protein
MSDSSTASDRKRCKRDKCRAEAKEAKKELKQLQCKGVESKLPTLYRGQDKYNDFEIWCYKLDQWLKDTGYTWYNAVRRMVYFFQQKAVRL